MENIPSLIFYLLLTGILLKLCKVKGDTPRIKRNIYIAYIILFMVAAIRYGIGNDYLGYAPNCTYTARWFQQGHSLWQGLSYFADDNEIAHIFICWLFQWMKHPFVGLYLAYSFLQVGLLYLILERDGEHYWGLFAFIICEFMFCSWDAIRQFTAVLIIVYSYAFVKDGKLFHFLGCVGVAWLFHHSAIYVLPAFFLRWVKLNKWLLVGFLSSVTVLAVSGIIQQFQDQVSMFFDLSEYYSNYGSNAAFTVVAESQAYRIRLLMVGVFYIAILIFYPKGNPLNELLMTFGASLFIFANNGLTLMRIACSLSLVALVLRGISFHDLNKKRLQIIKFGLMSMVLFIFCHDVIKDSNARGCAKYTTILTNDLDHLPQRVDE